VQPTKTAAAPVESSRGPRRGAEPLRAPDTGTPDSSTTTTAAEATDRDQMLDRLQHLRKILPVFAQELASARRHAAQLRRDNRRLLNEVHRLQRQRDNERLQRQHEQVLSPDESQRQPLAPV
jgi:hypothetical protein